MKLAVYYKDGEIDRVDGIKDTTEDLQAAVNDFNEKHKDAGKSVEICDFDDDSLVAYLWLTKNGNILNYRNQLQDIVNSISSLDSDLRWAEKLLEKMEESQ